MEMNSGQFLGQLADEQIVSQTEGISLDQFTKQPSQVVKPLLSFVAEQINTGHLAQGRAVVENASIEFKIETSIINLPLRYGKTIQKIVQDDTDYSVNVYMMIESPDINRSQLRIDEVGTADDVAADSEQYVEPIDEWIKQYLAEIDQNQKTAKLESAKEAKEAKVEAKKSKSNKSSATKKRTAKKSATKK